MSVLDKIKDKVGIETFQENASKLDVSLLESKKIVEGLKSHLSPSELKKIQSEYIDVINRYHREAREVASKEGEKVTKGELNKLKKELDKLISKSKEIDRAKKFEKSGRLPNEVEAAKKNILENKFKTGINFKSGIPAYNTSSYNVTSYMEYISNNEKEKSEFLKILNNDVEMLANFIIYWTGESKYKFLSSIGNYHHARSYLKDKGEKSIVNDFDILCKKEQQMLHDNYGVDLSYHKGKALKWDGVGVQQREARNKLENAKFEAENASFSITYDEKKDKNGEQKIYSIKPDVYKGFEQFVNDPNSSLKNLTNKQIARYFSFVYLIDSSIDSKPFASQINWGGKEPSVAEKINITKSFQEKLASDADGLVKIADNWGEATDPKEKLSIDRLLQAKDTRGIQRVALRDAIKGAQQAIGLHLNNFISINKPGISNQERTEIVYKINGLIVRCDTPTEFKKLFRGIKDILGKNGIAANEKDEDLLYKKIVQSKYTEKTLQAHKTLTEPKSGEKEKAAADLFIKEGRLVNINQFKDKKKHEKAKKDRDSALKTFKDKGGKKEDISFAKMIVGTKELVEHINIAGGIESKKIGKVLENLDKFENEEAINYIDNENTKNAIKDFAEGENNNFLKIVDSIIGSGKINSIDELFSNPRLRNKVILELEAKGNLNSKESELLEILSIYKTKHNKNTIKYLDKVQNIGPDEIDKILKKDGGEEGLDSLVNQGLGLKKSENDIKTQFTIENGVIKNFNDSYFMTHNKTDSLPINGVIVKRVGKGEYIIGNEKCNEKELPIMINSIKFLENNGLKYFTENMPKLTEIFENSSFITREAQINLDAKKGFGENEQKWILKGFQKILLPEAKNSDPVEICKKLKSYVNKGKMDELITSSGLFFEGRKEINYETLKTKLI